MKSEEQKQLISNLQSAYHFLLQEAFSTDFQLSLQKSIEKLKQNDFSVLDDLKVRFTPTGEWDDVAGEAGIEIGNVIYEQLLRFKK